MSHDLNNGVHCCTKPGQDSERASLSEHAQQVHVLAEVLEQAPSFSYGVPDPSHMIDPRQEGLPGT